MQVGNRDILHVRLSFATIIDAAVAKSHAADEPHNPQFSHPHSLLHFYTDDAVKRATGSVAL